MGVLMRATNARADTAIDSAIRGSNVSYRARNASVKLSCQGPMKGKELADASMPQRGQMVLSGGGTSSKRGLKGLIGLRMRFGVQCSCR